MIVLEVLLPNVGLFVFRILGDELAMADKTADLKTQKKKEEEVQDNMKSLIIQMVVKIMSKMFFKLNVQFVVSIG